VPQAGTPARTQDAHRSAKRDGQRALTMTITRYVENYISFEMQVLDVQIDSRCCSQPTVGPFKVQEALLFGPAPLLSTITQSCKPLKHLQSADRSPAHCGSQH
jgi:hypothetical protein